ncbi:hypothetical protein BJ138DRAFT_134282 [Hygrophoropsis aurantiaca]|uniref:Uncharacterized protein n=1 Tax=Hygrophoropsis aurantiaca TaxID=72124 RepID=A0ACB8AAH6_9AGAM|nr:hypothetical protein BJ138DRAFT_134282 [Hygrophoropsis aurantiaca]
MPGINSNHKPDESVVSVGPPFDAPDADIVLRSSDGADFRTYKLILSLASPVFRSMLTLPQPSETAASSTPPVISMPEDKHTLEKLLLHCYPGSSMTLDSVDDFKTILGAATKYDMQSILGSLRKSAVTSSLFQSNLLAFYAISCLQGWEAEARLAAFKLLEDNSFWLGSYHYFPELESISGGSYYRLTRYHARCGAAAQAIAQKFIWLDNKCSGRCQKVGTKAFGVTPHNFPKWLRTYLEVVGEELVRRPSASTVLNSVSFNAALLEAGQCTICGPHLVDNRLRNMFAAQVTETVSHIPLEFVSPTA